MKTILKLIIASIFAVSLAACGDKSPANPQPIPPVPKPVTPEQTAAFAAKKADYFIRLAFDLADGYLYNENVARKRYGTDSDYVRGLNFSRAYSEGIITSRDLGTFEFWYYRDDYSPSGSTGTYNVVITSYAFSGDDLWQKRSVVVNTANANHPAKRFNIKFTGADTASDNFTFDVWYLNDGIFTGKGAEIFAINPPMSFGVKDSSGTVNSFTASFANIKGKIKNAGANYNPGPSYDFIVEEGTLSISGLGYTINLSYSDNKAQGTFTGPSGFSAIIKLNDDGRYGAFYIADSAPDATRQIGWDFP
jgi:predicted small lipoprotein YifL